MILDFEWVEAGGIPPPEGLGAGRANPANKKAPPGRTGGGLIEDIMKAKGIGGHIPIFNDNFNPKLGDLSIF